MPGEGHLAAGALRPRAAPLAPRGLLRLLPTRTSAPHASSDRRPLRPHPPLHTRPARPQASASQPLARPPPTLERSARAGALRPPVTRTAGAAHAPRMTQPGSATAAYAAAHSRQRDATGAQRERGRTGVGDCRPRYIRYGVHGAKVYTPETRPPSCLSSSNSSGRRQPRVSSFPCVAFR